MAILNLRKLGGKFLTKAESKLNIAFKEDPFSAIKTGVEGVGIAINEFSDPHRIENLVKSAPNKFWRAKILFDRANPKKGPKLSEYTESDLETYVSGRPAQPNRVIRLYNMVTSPTQYIEFQTIPKELSIDSESTWAIIYSMGRNTPMYHYTGSESILDFEVSWYCNDPDNPAEVATKCRLLEAWSKANGYGASPPILKLQWGNENEDSLFQDQYWILTKANYKFSNWRVNNSSREAGSYVASTYKNPNMYPSTATQEIQLRRVSGYNLNYNMIVSPSLLRITKGINI